MKNNKFLIIYGVMIIVLLLVMFFIAPDDMFVKDNKNDKVIKDVEKKVKKYKDYEEQKKALLEGTYNYDLRLNYDGKNYECNANIKKKSFNGNCDISSNIINYDNKNYKNVLKKIGPEFFDFEYVLDLIKDIKPELKDYSGERKYTYDVKLYKLDGEIVINTDYDNINKITIANGYFVYVYSLKWDV